MNKIEFQTYPDGTQVRFTDDARRSMAGIVERHGLRPLGPRKSDPHGIFTITNTDDNLHDVVLNETGERWGIDWLEEVDVEWMSAGMGPVARTPCRSISPRATARLQEPRPVR